MADDAQLQRAAQATANAIAREYNSRYGDKIPVPVPLTFELELTHPKCAGMAYTQHAVKKGQRTIIKQWVELNMVLMRDNQREFLNKVIPHEMAHLDQSWRNQRSASESQDHGYVWQAAMRAMGQVPQAKHSMDLTKSLDAYRAHKAKLRQAKAAKPAKKAVKA